MFSTKEKQHIAAEVEKLLLSLNHPEMPKVRPKFTLHIDGKEAWSWADIAPNWTFEGTQVVGNLWNEQGHNEIERLSPAVTILHKNTKTP